MQLAEPLIKATELNALWRRQFQRLDDLRRDAIEYGAKMKQDGDNPFSEMVVKYEDAMIQLRDDLVRVCIGYYKDSYAPNVHISKDDLMRTMIDTLTDEETPVDRFSLPLAFDAEWVAAYIQHSYLDFADEVAEKQIRNRLYHYCYPVSKGLQDSLMQNENTIVIPFFCYSRNSGYCTVDEKTQIAVHDLDRLIQIRCMEADAADVRPNIFIGESLKWNRILQYPIDIFKEFDVERNSHPIVLHFHIYRDRQEMEVAFRKPSDASMIASVLSHHP